MAKARAKEYYDDRKVTEKDYGNGVSIKELNEQDRPREKALRSPESVKGLSEEELIAIIIRTGTKQANAKDLSLRILTEHDGSLLSLYRSLLNGSLYNLKGLGDVKKVSILAALELGLRFHGELTKADLKQPETFMRSDAAYRFMKQKLLGIREEQMWVLILSTGCRLIMPYMVAKGGISETSADVRTILRHVIRFSGSGFILMHNHPGGSMEPSKSDEELTASLLEASKTVYVTFLDHIIFTDYGYYSFRDSGNILK